MILCCLVQSFSCNQSTFYELFRYPVSLGLGDLCSTRHYCFTLGKVNNNKELLLYLIKHLISTRCFICWFVFWRIMASSYIGLPNMFQKSVGLFLKTVLTPKGNSFTQMFITRIDTHLARSFHWLFLVKCSGLRSSPRYQLNFFFFDLRKSDNILWIPLKFSLFAVSVLCSFRRNIL